MKAAEYQKQVLVTESRKFYNEGLLADMILSGYLKVHKNTLSSRVIQKRSIRLLHSGMGAVTEVGELFEMLEKESLDLTNLREEVGDITWYIAVATDELKIDLQSLMNKGLAEAAATFKANSEEQKRQRIQYHLAQATMASAMFLDLLKKGIFYGKDMPQEKLQKQLETIMTHSILLLQVGDFEIEESFDVNIAKLQKKRFKGGKFTETEAIVRNLAEERKTLEQKD